MRGLVVLAMLFLLILFSCWEVLSPVESRTLLVAESSVFALSLLAVISAACLVLFWLFQRQVRRRTVELRASQEKYRLLVENAAEGVAVMCGERLIFANPAVGAITGYAVEQLQSLHFSEWIHPEDHELMQAHFTETLGRRCTPTHCQFRIVPRTGEPRWILCHSVGILWEGRECCLGFFTDVTERKQAEELLRDERDFSRTLVQSSPAFFVAIRADGKTLMMNDSMLNALGYTAEEVRDKEYLETFVPERDWDSVRKTFERVVTQRQSTVSENHVLARDGRELLVEWQGRPVFKGDQLDYFFGVGIDVTERRQVEDALRESEEKYRTLYETMEQGVLYLNGEGAILSANPAAERILGRTQEQMKALAADGLCWNFIRENGDQFAEYDHPVAVVLRTGKPILNVVMGFVHPDQEETRWLLVNLIPQSKPGEVTPHQVYAMFSDITDRKRVLDALRESQEMAQAMLNATTDSVFLTDCNGTVITCNATALERLGKASGEVLGRSLFELFPAELATARRRQFDHVIRSKKPVRFEDTRDEMYFDNSIYPLFGPQEMGERLVVFAHDITDRKRAEESIQTQLEELRRWHEVTLHREERIQELKREVNTLLRRLGEPLRYASQDESSDASLLPETLEGQT